jgi:dihydrolipoamide dehydrogenase
MAETNFDVIVIGAGPGGYVAAIRAAQLGLKTACVESRETLGGTCLNVGCIPSKALLHASELFEEAAHGTLAKWGVKVGNVELDLDTMHAGRREAVAGLTKGIEFLFKKNKVTWLKGHARFTGANSSTSRAPSYTAKNIVIATGSSVTPLPGVEIDQERIVDSTGALELPKVPGHLVVIGGGVIGLELGSVWKRLGAKVTVVEYLDQILPGMDGEVRKESAKIFKKQGFELRTGTKVTGAQKSGEPASPSVEPAKGGEAETIEADVVLVAIGRRPNTDGLGLEAAGVAGQQARPDRGRPRFPHRRPRHLRDRRRDARPDARPQGGGRGRRGGRDPRRPDRHRQPRRDPERRLHHPEIASSAAPRRSSRSGRRVSRSASSR